MERLLIFGILSLPVIIISWRTLFNINNHGFYRFFSWECILWLFVSNYEFWFDDPFCIRQIFSWIFLFLSVYLVIAGAILIKKTGKPGPERAEKALYQFEKTSELVDKGIYKYIRHPLYSSLIYLTWGIFLKHTTVLLLFVALISTVFLFLTAIFDEKECTIFFGAKYREYMKRSKRFIPFII
jgi:protein-S-isoprenylcysteine O-methyltransferase Ste14